MNPQDLRLEFDNNNFPCCIGHYGVFLDWCHEDCAIKIECHWRSGCSYCTLKCDHRSNKRKGAGMTYEEYEQRLTEIRKKNLAVNRYPLTDNTEQIRKW